MATTNYVQQYDFYNDYSFHNNEYNNNNFEGYEDTIDTVTIEHTNVQHRIAISKTATQDTPTATNRDSGCNQHDQRNCSPCCATVSSPMCAEITANTAAMQP